MLIDNKVIVRCADDYDRATERIAELGTPPEGSEEEVELQALVDAVDEWQVQHEDDEWQ